MEKTEVPSEIEITPQMIEAGVKVYLEQDFDEEADLIRAIFLGMLRAR